MSALEVIALIARVEKATGPDRELDAEIAVAADGGEIVWKSSNGTMEQYPARRYASAAHIGGFGNAPVPRYTSSLDAAVSLVPEGAGVTLHRYYGRAPLGELWSTLIVTGFGDQHASEDRPSAALALTAAALRARLAEMDDGR